jgi:glucuronoarabinoxylan endo-1,4-beta-xylanase
VILLALLAQVTMNLAAPAQTIDGFGVSITAESISMSNATADLLWTQGSGIGLKYARLRIGSYGPGEGYFGAAGTMGDAGVSKEIARMAVKRGATVVTMSASPPAAMKTTGSTVSGSLNLADYTNYSNYLVAAVNDAKMSGITVSYVGVQNEPDFDTGGVYEMCLFTAAQMRDYIKNLGPIFASLSPVPKLIVPESEQFQDLSGYTTTILADTTAAGFSDVIATHTYGSPTSISPPSVGSKPIWMTEMSGIAGPFDATMTHGLTVAQWIYDALITGNVTAWFWWQFRTTSNDNQGLLGIDGTVAKRLYVLGNFSKFARPGMVRFPFTGTPPTNVSVAGFKDPTSNNVAIVAINNQASTASLTVTLDSTTKVQVVTPWLTDATHNLIAQTPVLLTTGHAFTYTLPANSVVTFSGVGT